MFQTQLDETVREVPESYHPVSPVMDGWVEMLTALPPATVKKYWFTWLKVTAWAELIVTVLVVNVPVVAMFVLVPPSRFHEVILCPTPPDRVLIPFVVTVRVSPYLYQPSSVSDDLEVVTLNPPLIVSCSCKSYVREIVVQVPLAHVD